MKPEELAEAGFYHSPRDKEADMVFMKNHIQLNNANDWQIKKIYCDDAYQVISFKEYVDIVSKMASLVYESGVLLRL